MGRKRCGFRWEGAGRSLSRYDRKQDFISDFRSGRRAMMDGPWFGIAIMLAMVVGLVRWCWWAMRKDKDEKGDEKA